MRHRVDALLVKGNADRHDGLARAQAAQGAVVKTSAIAQAPALAIEGQQRDEEMSGSTRGLSGVGSAMPQTPAAV